MSGLDTDGDNDGSGGNGSTDSHGTKPGGGPLDSHGTHPGGGPLSVTNQQVLVLDISKCGTLTQAQLTAITVAQIKFARDVSISAAKAYNRVLQAIEPNARES